MSSRAQRRSTPWTSSGATAPTPSVPGPGRGHERSDVRYDESGCQLPAIRQQSSGMSRGSWSRPSVTVIGSPGDAPSVPAAALLAEDTGSSDVSPMRCSPSIRP